MGSRPLQTWVERIQEAHLSDADVYVYFNNDPGGAAVVNSAEFALLAGQAGLTVTRTPAVGDVALNAAHTDLVILRARAAAAGTPAQRRFGQPA